MNAALGDRNLACVGIKRARPFNRKNLPQLIRLYKKGWTIAALKRKWHCYGNPITKLLIEAGVYRGSQLCGTHEYGLYSRLRWHCVTGKWHTKFLFKSFDHFLNEVGPRPSKKHWLRKVDRKGGFAPGNVHWWMPHGKSHTPEYHIYVGARYRCTNPKSEVWKDYGGRGIQFRFVSFEEFLAELGPRPSPEYSLDRINNDGHYEPGNVRWATASEQRNNQRCSIKDVEEDEIPEAP